MNVIFKAFGLKFELIILCLKYSFRRSFLFNFFRMLDKQVIFIHLGEVSLFPDINELRI